MDDMYGMAGVGYRQQLALRRLLLLRIVIFYTRYCHLMSATDTHEDNNSIFNEMLYKP